MNHPEPLQSPAGRTRASARFQDLDPLDSPDEGRAHAAAGAGGRRGHVARDPGARRAGRGRRRRQPVGLRPLPVPAGRRSAGRLPRGVVARERRGRVDAARPGRDARARHELQAARDPRQDGRDDRRRRRRAPDPRPRLRLARARVRCVRLPVRPPRRQVRGGARGHRPPPPRRLGDLRGTLVHARRRDRPAAAGPSDADPRRRPSTPDDANHGSPRRRVADGVVRPARREVRRRSTRPSWLRARRRAATRARSR